MQKVRLLVSGRVQGVGFRYSTYALALEIGDIYGRKGPSKWSKVTYVDVTMANFSNYSDFRMAN